MLVIKQMKPPFKLDGQSPFYFATGVQRGTSIGGMPQSSKTIAGGPINMAPLK
jgi:hypothetical protein